MPRKAKEQAITTNDYGTRLTVSVMAKADGYAMVRVKGCKPFVVPEKKLEPIK